MIDQRAREDLIRLIEQIWREAQCSREKILMYNRDTTLLEEVVVQIREYD